MASRGEPVVLGLRANAAQFQRCFERGLAVAGFERTATEGIYLLGPWE